MPRVYNFIYRQLVKDESDVVGHIAYSLYKADKISFIEDYKKKHENQEPSDERFEHFHESCCLPANIQRYRMQAVEILQGFVDDTLEETTKQIEADYVKHQD